MSKIQKFKEKALNYYEEHKFFVGYSVGVILTGALTYYLNSVIAKTEDRLWDEANEDARLHHGENAFAVKDRNLNVYHFWPDQDE